MRTQTAGMNFDGKQSRKSPSFYEHFCIFFHEEPSLSGQSQTARQGSCNGFSTREMVPYGVYIKGKGVTRNSPSQVDVEQRCAKGRFLFNVSFELLKLHYCTSYLLPKKNVNVFVLCPQMAEMIVGCVVQIVTATPGQKQYISVSMNNW